MQRKNHHLEGTLCRSGLSPPLPLPLPLGRAPKALLLDRKPAWLLQMLSAGRS
jgi:hypothetical protein